MPQKERRTTVAAAPVVRAAMLKYCPVAAMYLVAVTALLCAAASRADTLRLTAPLPAMEQFAAGETPAVTAYHEPVGVPEAARIAAAEASARPPLRIVGGLGSFRGEHPFMAGLVISLTSGQTSVCGGALLTAARVLTAAACYWDGRLQARSMLAVLGSVRLFSGGARVQASSIAVHSSFSPASIHYNVAVLTIPDQTFTEYVKPIGMASGGDYTDYRAEVIGYGRTSDSAPITTEASLRDVFLDVISNAECRNFYGSQISAAEMCTSGAGGRGPCGGDHGGPLILYSSSGDDLLLGVFTFSSVAGCSAGAPAGYQRVSHYYNWIVNQL